MYRIPICAASLCLFIAAPAHHAGQNAGVSANKVATLAGRLEPDTSQRRNSPATLVTSSLPDIPGLTYPRLPPPDLVAKVPPPEPVEPAPTVAEPEERAPAIALVLTADLAAQRLTVRENGSVTHVWAISSGRPGYETEAGTFRPQWTSRLWYSRQYDRAPMPYAIFFNGGTAFHAAHTPSVLGHPSSHGCLRLAVADAKQLYELVHRHGFQATQIVVQGMAKGELAQQGSKPGSEAKVDRRRQAHDRVRALPADAPGVLRASY